MSLENRRGIRFDGKVTLTNIVYMLVMMVGVITYFGSVRSDVNRCLEQSEKIVELKSELKNCETRLDKLEVQVMNLDSEVKKDISDIKKLLVKIGEKMNVEILINN